MASKKVPFPTIFIRHRGNFEFDKTCQNIRSWYDNKGYEFHATKHKHKVAEEEIKYYGEINVTGYIRFYIHLVIRTREMKPVEVIKDGQKIKMHHGLIAFDVIPSYELDYENRFGGNKWLKAIQDFYHKYVIKRKIEDYWEDELFLHVGELVQVIKASLEYEAM
jgi:hypothetical protein